MKRIEPRKQYDVDGGYPSVADVDLSRRDFFGAAVVGAVGLGLGLGGAVLLPDVAEAGRRHGYQKIVVPLRYRYLGCKVRLEKIVVQSRDRRLIAFLGKAKELRGVLTLWGRVLAKHKCRDLQEAKRRGPLQVALGKVLAVHYRTRTRRRTQAPLVTLIVGRIRSPGPVDGDVMMPSIPLLP
jgi:hypothetical protein